MPLRCWPAAAVSIALASCGGNEGSGAPRDAAADTTDESASARVDDAAADGGGVDAGVDDTSSAPPTDGPSATPDALDAHTDATRDATTGVGDARDGSEGSAPGHDAAGELDAAPVLVSLTVTPSNPTISQGCVQQVTATAGYSSGTSADVTSQATWYTSSPGVGSVGANGRFICVAAGSTSVTASFGGLMGMAAITCSAAAFVQVVVAPPTASTVVGGTVQFTASAFDTSSAQCDVTQTVIWEAVTPSVATIASGGSSAGLATALSSGDTMIRATLDAKFGEADLVVDHADAGASDGRDAQVPDTDP